MARVVKTEADSADTRDWHRLMPLAEFGEDGVRMRRVAGKQIVVWQTPRGLRACDNRCPHEGYPLVEGSLSADCILTCNWHNWKFDLDSGDNLYGGDRLRTYPVELRDDDVWVDLSEAPYDERYREVTRNLRAAFDDYSYDRIAREIARLERLGADPLDALRLAIDWSWRRLEFGWTHAYAGMADWLTLRAEHAGDPELELVCLLEAVAHVAYDVRRERDYPFAAGAETFTEDAFVAAIEAEDEPAAIRLLRGGLGDGLGFAEFEPALSRAALAHYNDFGHALIYVVKAGELVARLGDSVLEPLLLALARGFVYASREDKIPEFRGYAAALADWGRGTAKPSAERWWRQGIDASLAAAVDCSAGPPEAIYRALLVANATNLLNFDLAHQDEIHVSVSGNVGWLDFTHGLTFAGAVRRQCSRFPELWPQGLLQMACFAGRNAGFTRRDTAEVPPADDLDARTAALVARVLDHGQGEHIVSVHLLKTLLAARDEMTGLDPGDAAVVLAAVEGFFTSPLKRRHARRTAHQSLKFVARE